MRAAFACPGIRTPFGRKGVRNDLQQMHRASLSGFTCEAVETIIRDNEIAHHSGVALEAGIKRQQDELLD
jgi:hypothetical protein